MHFGDRWKCQLQCRLPSYVICLINLHIDDCTRRASKLAKVIKLRIAIIVHSDRAVSGGGGGLVGMISREMLVGPWMSMGASACRTCVDQSYLRVADKGGGELLRDRSQSRGSGLGRCRQR